MRDPQSSGPAEVLTPGIDAGETPLVSLAEALHYQLGRTGVRAAARALASRIRTDKITDLPLDVELSVIVDNDVEIFHYQLTRTGVELSAQPAPDARLKLTMQRAVDLALMENGVPLIVIIASGRAAISGEFNDVLGVFGNASYPVRAGRRPFADMCDLLARSQDARPQEISKILDEFGRAVFARELTQFFTDAMILSGMTEQLPAMRIRMLIGDVANVIDVAQRRCSVEPDEGHGPYDVMIQVPKMETAVLRLLGKIGDMDAVLSRQILLSGDYLDDLIPLLEHLSSGISVFTTTASQAEWAFPT